MPKLEPVLKPKATFGTADAVCVYEISHTVGKFHCPFSGQLPQLED